MSHTIADKIRAMSDEELAELLNGELGFCKNLLKCGKKLLKELHIPDAWCKECILKWLREPADATKPATMADEEKQHSGLIEED